MSISSDKTNIKVEIIELKHDKFNQYENTPTQTLRHLRILNIKPDSPRTQQACLELGINPQLMDLKPEEQFMAPDVSKDISLLRYEHYLRRLHQSWLEIQQRRREIIQRNRSAIIHPKNLSKPTNESSSGNNNQVLLSSFQDYNNQFQQHSQVNQIHSKTLQYLHQSHNHPDIVEPCKLFSPAHYQQSSLRPFKREIEKDLRRYNRMKTQKIREASIKLEEENKRFQLMENLSRKNQQVYTVAVKHQSEKNIHIMQLRQISESKEKRNILADEVNWLKNKNQQEQSLNKIQKLKEKQNLEYGLRLKVENEEQQKLLQKKTNRELIVKENQQLQREYQQQSLQKIEEKLQASEKQHESFIHSQITRMRDNMNREHDQILKQKDLKEAQDQRNLSLLINKMVHKEEAYRNHMKIEIEGDLKKRSQKLLKEKMTEITKKQINRNMKLKARNLDEKFLRIDENNISRKIQQEDRMVIRQELRRLKDQDKFENQQRFQRMNDHITQKMILKNRNAQYRLDESKAQKSILQQTSLEMSREGNIERQRIYSGLQEVSNQLYYQKSSTFHNKPQSEQKKARSLKILKSLFGETQAFINKDKTKQEILTLLRPTPEIQKESPNSKLRKV